MGGETTGRGSSPWQLRLCSEMVGAGSQPEGGGGREGRVARPALLDSGPYVQSLPAMSTQMLPAPPHPHTPR